MPNLYFQEAKHAYEAVVKHRLKEQDHAALAKGGIKLHTCGPAASIRMGLLIEDTQCHLVQDFKATEENPLTLMQQKEQHDRHGDADSVYAMCSSLVARYAALTAEQRMEGCKGKVVKIEEDLREAQCLDALDVIRGIIRAQHDSYAYHDRNM
ncbi:uncharacterized protein ARMOST_20339 [Armillaria ostoyae]|uniref:Uncharacterized protein n=1 Tax=Armillaria ostoyae TaxID=47428 RepID=A0A284S737_ARMOS|nr:uncharacterized protein ARMOST_20339 [Armillaria ostoyae]